MNERQLKNIVIVGGGTSGWMTAAMLAKVLDGKLAKITLIESEQIGTVGVGEATIPPINTFNKRVGLDEAEFMRETNATFKMGIEFVNWGKIGDAYLHPFGSYGKVINGVGFHHYWRRSLELGMDSAIGDYNLANVAAKQNRFKHRVRDPKSIYSSYAHAFHFDAGLYAKYLRRKSEAQHVRRIEGRIVDVKLASESGFIESVRLEDGSDVAGDLFIDCSGFRSLLIGEALGVGYEDWTHWLPCDRAVAVPSEKVSEPIPYTRATAGTAGWQWRIPLQNRTGNGHVYCSAYLNDDEATATALDNIEGAAIAEPRVIKFKTGKRKQMWARNCVAIGLSGGFLEPLESTSIWLIQASIYQLLKFLPDRGFSSADIDTYNKEMDRRFEEVRDFLILHYKLTQRTDSEFWRDCANMSIPDSLAHRMEVFRTSGHVVFDPDELFVEPSWLSVYLGQHNLPESCDPRVYRFGDDELRSNLEQIRAMVAEAADDMPSHAETIADYCTSQASNA